MNAAEWATRLDNEAYYAKPGDKLDSHDLRAIAAELRKVTELERMVVRRENKMAELDASIAEQDAEIARLKALSSALADVAEEREHQEAKWGEQNHAFSHWMLILGEEVGEACESVLHVCTTASPTGTRLWRQSYRDELVQVAAVAVAAIESFDRNEAHD